MYGENPGFTLQTGIQLANAVNAIADTWQKRKDQAVQDQANQVFNVLVQKPDLMHLDDTARPTAMQDGAAQAKQKQNPFQGYDPQAVSMGRLAALKYFVDKGSLSNSMLQQKKQQADLAYDALSRDMKHAATLWDSGMKDEATQTVVNAFNRYYPNGHHIKIESDGTFSIYAPTGKGKHFDHPFDAGKMIQSFFTNPAMKSELLLKESLQTGRTIQNLNYKALLNPERLYDETGQHMLYRVKLIDPQTHKPYMVLYDGPPAAPGTKVVKQTPVEMHTEEAWKAKQSLGKAAQPQPVKDETTRKILRTYLGMSSKDNLSAALSAGVDSSGKDREKQMLYAAGIGMIDMLNRVYGNSVSGTAKGHQVTQWMETARKKAEANWQKLSRDKNRDKILKQFGLPDSKDEYVKFYMIKNLNDITNAFINQARRQQGGQGAQPQGGTNTAAAPSDALRDVPIGAQALLNQQGESSGGGPPVQSRSNRISLARPGASGQSRSDRIKLSGRAIEARKPLPKEYQSQMEDAAATRQAFMDLMKALSSFQGLQDPNVKAGIMQPFRLPSPQEYRG